MLEGFRVLAEAVDEPAQVAVFLSTAPSLFGQTIARLASAGLAGPGVRLALEKPLGSDLASSRAIDNTVAAAYGAGDWGSSAAIALNERDSITWRNWAGLEI